MAGHETTIGWFEPPSQLVGQDSAEKPARISIDVRLDEVVLRALEKHPEKRYGSASAIMHDIDEIESHPQPSVAAKILPEEHRRRVRDTVHRAGEAAGNFAAASVARSPRARSRSHATPLPRTPRRSWPTFSGYRRRTFRRECH